MATIIPRKRADGTIGYQVQILISRESGKPHRETKTFDREHAAKTWAKRREKALKLPGALDQAKVKDPKLTEVIDQYIRESERAMGRTKAQVLRAIKTMAIADMRCSDIRSSDYVAFAQSLKVKPQTRANYLSHLGSIVAIARPMWSYPLDQQGMKDAFVVCKRMGITSKSKARDRRPTLDELDKIMLHYGDRQRRRPGMAPMQKLVAFALFSTRRQEEIVRIRWADLDEDGARILVRDMKNPGEKIGNDVWCDLPAEALAIIKSMPRSGEFIFPHSSGAISASFTRTTAFLGFPDLTFHDLRHEGISRLEIAPRKLYSVPVIAVEPAVPMGPTPFQWMDPDDLPRREWLYSTILIRKEVSATLAPGGVGKTSLTIAEALAMVSGKPLLGIAPPKRLRVWLWNGEEPFEEMQRRIMAACRRFELNAADIEGYLFVDTAETMPLVLAEDTRDGTIINRPMVDQLSDWLVERKIDALFVDPFISTHNVNENDNNAIQKATTAWKEVAQKANVAIGAAHHTRKTQGREATAEDSRGAKSFTDKCRVTRSLNPMSKEEAERFGIDQSERRSFFSYDPTEMKANMSPATGGKVWFKTVSETIGKGRRGNLDPGDSVAVVEPWMPPSARALAGLSTEEIKAVQAEVAKGEQRADERSPQWVGNAVSRALGLEADAITKKRVKAIIDRLVAEGHLRIADGYDASRRPRSFVEVGIEP